MNFVLKIKNRKHQYFLIEKKTIIKINRILGVQMRIMEVSLPITYNFKVKVSFS